MMQSSDAELVQQALLGNARAFGSLVDRYKNAAYGAAYARLGAFSDAQDIVQEAFLLAYRKLSDLQKPERFGTWLYSIVCNLCHDHLRARKATKAFDEAHPHDLADPAIEHDRRALHRRIQRAIANLPEIYRESVTLHYLQGYKVNEIGAFLDVPVGTVKRRLSDARQQLKEDMIDMARDMFDANPLSDNFQKVIVERVDKMAEAARAKLYVRNRSQRGFSVEVVGHQQSYVSLALAKKHLPRPFTYDLIRDICKGFKVVLDRVAIVQNRDALAAEIAFSRGQKSQVLQISPGYALALALAFDAPVFADKVLLEKTLKKIPESKEERPVSIRQIDIAPHMTWATFEETDGKLDRIRLALYIQGKTGKMPSQRARLRRLTSADLVSMDVVQAKTQPQNPKYPMILLGTKNKDRVLPIAIGDYEAGAIAAVLPQDRVDLPDNLNVRERGHIYDFLKIVLDAFGIVCHSVVIDLLQGDIFCALGCFQRGKKQVRLDARPSDAIAIALRFNAGIAVDRAILDRLPDAQKLKAGQKRQPDRHILPVGASVKLALPSRRKFDWESTAPSVARVSQEGVVTALKAGAVDISATWRGKKTQCVEAFDRKGWT